MRVKRKILMRAGTRAGTRSTWRDADADGCRLSRIRLPACMLGVMANHALRKGGAVAAYILITIMTGGCAAKNQKGSTAATADASYRKLADEYFSGYLAWRPAAGTGLGLHEYD